MNKNHICFMFFCAISTFEIYPSEEKQRPLTLTESCIVGAVTAAAEVVIPGQILTYGMNQAIKKQPFVIQHCYRGFAANAIGEMPIGAIQKVVQTKGSQAVESLQGRKISNLQNVAISYGAGVVGAVVDTPSNAVQLYLQEKSNAGKSTWRACKALGFKSFRGFAPNAFIKEGPFTLAYQVAADQGEKCTQGYFDNPISAKIVGGIGAGILAAFVTQPGAVLRNKMQTDVSGKVYETTRQTIQKIITEEGWKGLFSGIRQRGIRIAIAVPLYAAYTKALEVRMRR